MRIVKGINIAVLFLLLGTIVPIYAQKGQEEKGGGGQKGQQPQHSQQPQRAQQVQRSQQQPQRTQQALRSQQQPQRTQQALRSQQQSQRTQQAQRSQQQPQRTQQAQRSQQQPQRTQQAQQGQHRLQGQLSAGRIPDARFRSNFGRGHQFHMSQPVYYGGYSQFQYSGYWFDFDDPWPSDWRYSDDVYVDYYGNVYYLYNPRHPGVRIAIRIAL